VSELRLSNGSSAKELNERVDGGATVDHRASVHQTMTGSSPATMAAGRDTLSVSQSPDFEILTVPRQAGLICRQHARPRPYGLRDSPAGHDLRGSIRYALEGKDVTRSTPRTSPESIWTSVASVAAGWATAIPASTNASATPSLTPQELRMVHSILDFESQLATRRKRAPAGMSALSE
jgi:hypothetical protein